MSHERLFEGQRLAAEEKDIRPDGFHPKLIFRRTLHLLNPVYTAIVVERIKGVLVEFSASSMATIHEALLGREASLDLVCEVQITLVASFVAEFLQTMQIKINSNFILEHFICRCQLSLWSDQDESFTNHGVNLSRHVRTLNESVYPLNLFASEEWQAFKWEVTDPWINFKANRIFIDGRQVSKQSIVDLHGDLIELIIEPGSLLLAIPGLEQRFY